MTSVVFALAFVVAACASAPAPSATPSATPPASVATPVEPPPVVLPPAGWQTACQGIEAGMCRQMANEAEASRLPGDPPLHTILVRCTTPPCTAEQGNGETVLLFIDGSSRSVSEWGYSTALPASTPPGPVATPAGDWDLVCAGVGRLRCEELAEESFLSIDLVGIPLVKVTVRCTAASCTEADGQGVTVATFADGSIRNVGSWDYSTQVAPPVP